MQSLNNPILARCLRTTPSLIAPCSTNAPDTCNPNSTVLVETINASCKMVVLNRPGVLNALDTTLVSKLLKLYKSWEVDPNVGYIVAKGNGRAFCAGGDVISVYHMINEGRLDYAKRNFRLLYTLIHLISSYSKPHVSILNGITMGGGSGISVPGRFRVATDKTVYAIPETFIGFHPDAGASYYLPRLPGHLGEYLGLTGDRLNGAEMLACGLATHYTNATRVPLIEEQLARLETNDPSEICALLDYYSEPTCLEHQSALKRMKIINECFGCDTVEDIFTALESRAKKANDEWCNSTLKKLKAVSLLSLKVALKSIRVGRYQTIEECLAREYRMTVQAIHGNISKDFTEGVRTRLVDKTFTPKWNPSSLDQVSEDMVNRFFLPLSRSEPSLDDLPINRNQSSWSSTLSWEDDAVLKAVSREEAMEDPSPKLRKAISYVKARL